MSYATAQYGKYASDDLPSREVEAMALARVNRMLKEEEFSPNRQKALSMNQRLWTLLLRSIDSVSMSDTLRSDLMAVGSWASRYSLSAMNRKISLAPLIDVNANIIDGLRGQ